MPKLTLNDVTSGYSAATVINANNDRIETALENTLSRDGSTPNTMGASLDMNSNRVVNLGSPQSGTDAARWADVTDALSISTALPSQTGNADKAVFTDGSTLAWRKTPYIARTAAEIAASVTPSDYSYEPGNLLRYGADPTGAADCATAITNAWLQYQQATGSPIRAPAGTYRVNTQITFTSASSPTFRQGPVIIGDGRERTVFDSRVSSGHLFSVVAGGTAGSTFVTGARFQGFKIINTGAPSTSSGIRLLTSYHTDIEDVWITGLTGNGLTVPCILGDNDASNMVKLRQVRIDTCAGWGIKADGDSGRNETSFMHLENVFIQGCGTNVVGTPTSGGMIWKGQVLTLQQCAFTINENVALYVPGQAGLGQTVDIQNTAIENNKKRGIYCTGAQAFRGRQVQFYNNNTYTATNACEFDGASFVVRNVDFEGSVVRATSSNNPYTAFKISGSNADLQSCRIRRVVWDNFDYTGQTRFDGWLFDHVPQECQLVVDSSTSLIFRARQAFAQGRTSPLRLRGGAGGTPSTSGEWIPYTVSTSGLSITNASLANSTRYYTYLYDNNGAAALELSTSVPVLNTASGYMVKTADATRLFVGSVITNGSAQFETTGTGWLNPIASFLGATSLGSPLYLWADSTGDLRVKASAPTSDTDGTVVGTQT